DVVQEIKQAGGEAIASTLSISEPGNGDKIVKAALDAFGRVDILVNNAGILRDRIFHRMSWSDWSDVIAVHLHGSFNMSRACATHFREQNSGAYVHMTSTSGLVGNFGQANYSAAKLGIVALSKSIALDIQRFNVRSNAVAPTPGAHVTGQIFGVRNNEIFLFSQPRPIRTAHTSDGWTAETIPERVFPMFANDFYPLHRSSDVFTWDPVLSPAHPTRPDPRAPIPRNSAPLYRARRHPIRVGGRPRPRSGCSRRTALSLGGESRCVADLRG